MWPSKGLLDKNLLRTDSLLWLSFAFIHVSPALASVGLGIFLMQLFFLGDWVKPLNAEKWACWGLVLALGWNIWSLVDSGFTHWMQLPWQGDVTSGILQQRALAKALIKLPLLLVFILFALGKRLKTVFYQGWFWCVLPLIWIGVGSVLHYLQHRAFYDQMVLESKPLALYSKVYHIEFAAMMGLVCVLLLRGLLGHQIRGHLQRNGAWMVLCLLVLCMHILGSRTGLLLLYAGGFAQGVMFFLYTPKKWGRSLLIGAIILGGVFVLPSTKNRLQNTYTDFRNTIEGGDVTHQSFGQRWIAWQSAVFILKNEPSTLFLGSGVAADEKLRAGYEKLDVPLAERHRIGVHNQWLETSLQSGVFSSVGLLLFGFLVFAKKQKASGLQKFPVWMALVISMMFESLLERQAGVLVTVIAFQVLVGHEFVSDTEIKKEDTLIH